MSTRGERIAEDVRVYLATNGLKQSQLTGAVLAELIDRRLVHEEIVARKKKRLATEADWIEELEKEPHLAGVDVRKELAGAQFWCKNNNRQCTRRFFVNWLEKASRSVVVSPGGAKSLTTAAKLAETAPSGWLAILNRLFPDSVYAKSGLFEITAESEYNWRSLPQQVRDSIRGAA